MSLFQFSILDHSCSIMLRLGTFNSFGVDCTSTWLDRLAQVFGS